MLFYCPMISVQAQAHRCYFSIKCFPKSLFDLKLLSLYYFSTFLVGCLRTCLSTEKINVKSKIEKRNSARCTK